MVNDVAIVTPVFNDWPSFSCLLGELARQHSASGPRFHVIAVNDGSKSGFVPEEVPHWTAGAVRSVEILHLAVNLGHQRAIAVGLSVLSSREDIATVVVMDCDGEDPPDDIAALLAVSSSHPGKVVLARRTRRTETMGFRFGYALYKLIFRLLTGHTINFGNFSALPIAAVRRLVRAPDLWNNLPAAIMRSRLDTIAVPMPRGRRFAGQSRMNLAGLIVHGLSAMAVFSEVIFVRVLLGALASGALTLLMMIGVVAIRFLTTAAIPGWTSTVFGDLTILLVQVVVTIVATSFILLSSRSHRPIIPFADAASFVVKRETIHPHLAPRFQAAS